MRGRDHDRKCGDGIMIDVPGVHPAFKALRSPRTQERGEQWRALLLRVLRGLVRGPGSLFLSPSHRGTKVRMPSPSAAFATSAVGLGLLVLSPQPQRTQRTQRKGAEEREFLLRVLRGFVRGVLVPAIYRFS